MIKKYQLTNKLTKMAKMIKETWLRSKRYFFTNLEMLNRYKKNTTVKISLAVLQTLPKTDFYCTFCCMCNLYV